MILHKYTDRKISYCINYAHTNKKRKKCNNTPTVKVNLKHTRTVRNCIRRIEIVKIGFSTKGVFGQHKYHVNQYKNVIDDTLKLLLKIKMVHLCHVV